MVCVVAFESCLLPVVAVAAEQALPVGAPDFELADVVL